jgi:broad specificity phosphatase PhoE
VSESITTLEELTRKTFWFLRHGETDWNAEGRSQGRTDIPLNQNGIDQAHRAAKALRHRGIRAIVSSPLVRARGTAAIVGEALNLPVMLDEGLQEVSFGDQEGQPMGNWYDDWIVGNYTPKGGETFAALKARAVAAINRAMTQSSPVLVVGHGAMFRALRAAMGLPPNVRTPNALPLLCHPGSAAWTLQAVG